MKDNKKSVFNVGGKYTCASSVKFDDTVETTKTIGLLNSICPETIRASSHSSDRASLSEKLFFRLGNLVVKNFFKLRNRIVNIGSGVVI